MTYAASFGEKSQGMAHVLRRFPKIRPFMVDLMM